MAVWELRTTILDHHHQRLMKASNRASSWLSRDLADDAARAASQHQLNCQPSYAAALVAGSFPRSHPIFSLTNQDCQPMIYCESTGGAKAVARLAGPGC